MKGEGMKINDIVLQHVRIGQRNFAGEEKKFNPKGRRNFRVYLDDGDLINSLIAEGWNVRSYTRIDDEIVYYLDVTVNFDNRPPKIVVRSSAGDQILTEESVKMLDTADLLNVDVVIHPYSWEVNGKAGIKAYLKTMYATLDEDPLDLIYNQQ